MSTEQASPMGKEKQASFRLNYRKQNMSLNYLKPPFPKKLKHTGKIKDVVDSYSDGWEI